MIEWISLNRSIVVIGLVMLIGFLVPMESLVSLKKHESLNVPKFEIPSDVKIVEAGKPGSYGNIKTRVFLGDDKKKVSENLTPKTKKKIYPRLRLKAIMIDGDRRVANINGAMMKVGGRIHMHKILKIRDSGVLIDGPTGRRTLTIK